MWPSHLSYHSQPVSFVLPTYQWAPTNTTVSLVLRGLCTALHLLILTSYFPSERSSHRFHLLIFCLICLIAISPNASNPFLVSKFFSLPQENIINSLPLPNVLIIQISIFSSRLLNGYSGWPAHGGPCVQKISLAAGALSFLNEALSWAAKAEPHSGPWLTLTTQFTMKTINSLLPCNALRSLSSRSPLSFLKCFPHFVLKCSNFILTSSSLLLHLTPSNYYTSFILSYLFWTT